MCIKCISSKSFIETRTMHPKSRQVEVYMGSDTENVIDTLFNTLLQNFQRIQETSNERGSKFIPDSVELVGNTSGIFKSKEYFEKENNLAAINVLFVPHNSEEMKLAYKASYNERKNQVILLMINDEVNNYYYFAIKNLSELNSFGWLQGKKESINNNNNDNNNNNFQNALDDALNDQTIETHPERISKLKLYINEYN